MSLHVPLKDLGGVKFLWDPIGSRQGTTQWKSCERSFSSPSERSYKRAAFTWITLS
jgi:hypothetical protein